MWRGSIRFGLSVAAPFVWQCLSNLVITPFPHPSHRTGHADFRHPALGHDLTPSHTPRYISSRAQTYEPKVPVKVREWIRPATMSSDLVLVAQPPAQPRCHVTVDRTIGSANVPYTEVVRPAAQKFVRFNLPTSSVVFFQPVFMSVSSWTLSTMRLILFFDGHKAI